MKLVDKVDLDVGETRRSTLRSVEVLGIPLPMVLALVINLAVVFMWLGRRDDRLETVIEQNKEIKEALYRQADATRDFALRDDRISELGRRVSILEQISDGRRR